MSDELITQILTVLGLLAAMACGLFIAHRMIGAARVEAARPPTGRRYTKTQLRLAALCVILGMFLIFEAFSRTPVSYLRLGGAGAMLVCAVAAMRGILVLK